MDRKKHKFKKYSERHLRRLVRNELLNSTRSESSADSSDNEIIENGGHIRTIENADPIPMELETDVHSSHTISAFDHIAHESNCSSEECISLNSHSSDSGSSSSELLNPIAQDDDLLTFPTSDKRSDSPTAAFKKDLVEWSLKFNIPHNALSSLLATLNNHTEFQLPCDARTLLHTPRDVIINQLDNGHYYHFGVDKVLKDITNCYLRNDINTNTINLILNIDGLPISKSSSSCIWPILFSETELKKVYLCGAYHGTEKPKDGNNFLQRTVEELKTFVLNGFTGESKNYNVNLYALVCDSPAKSFVLSIKGHSGFSSCIKCTIHGEYSNDRVCFPDSSLAEPRSHQSFVAQADDDFNLGETILKDVPGFDLVLDVPYDYMHLVCLGVVKKIITLLIKGPLTVRISGAHIKRISSILEDLRDTVPSEFVRKTRSLDQWKRWKATEFRQFILYVAPFVLRNEVRPDVYLNVLTLHVAITILSSPSLLANAENVDYARELLKHFVSSFIIIYGKQFVSHNIHALLHLADDVSRYGCLDNVSAFRFENYMMTIKKQMRKSDKPLQQLAKRHEENSAISVEKENQTFPKLLHNHNSGPLPVHLDSVDSQFKIFETEKFILKTEDEKNNCCMLMDGTIVEILNIIVIKKQYLIVGRPHSLKESFFTSPCQSSLINIFDVKFSKRVKNWKTDEIISKMWKIPKHNDSFLVIPVLHTKF